MTHPTWAEPSADYIYIATGQYHEALRWLLDEMPRDWWDYKGLHRKYDLDVFWIADFAEAKAVEFKLRFG